MKRRKSVGLLAGLKQARYQKKGLIRFAGLLP